MGRDPRRARPVADVPAPARVLSSRCSRWSRETCASTSPPDPAAFAREIDREFPAVRRVVDDLYPELARTNAIADVAFGRDAVWPPGGFWERREVARITATLPHIEEVRRDASLAELPRDHVYRAIVDATARFASYACDLPPFAVARLHGAWTRGVAAPRPWRGRARRVSARARPRPRRGDAARRARFVDLAPGGARDRRARRRGRSPDRSAIRRDRPSDARPARPRDRLRPSPAGDGRAPAPRGRRAALRRECRRAKRRDPASLATESFLLPGLDRSGRPAGTLQRAPSASPVRRFLVAEALLPAGGHPKPAVAREAILRALEQKLPFIERHYLVVDSVHDGRPLWDYRGGSRREIRSREAPSRRRIDRRRADGAPLPRRSAVLHGLAGEPLRAPLANACLAGRTALPTLGQEGELLAAWGAARIITRTDRRKEQMRREMWSKVELG